MEMDGILQMQRTKVSVKSTAARKSNTDDKTYQGGKVLVQYDTLLHENNWLPTLFTFEFDTMCLFFKHAKRNC